MHANVLQLTEVGEYEERNLNIEIMLNTELSFLRRKFND